VGTDAKRPGTAPSHADTACGNARAHSGTTATCDRAAHGTSGHGTPAAAERMAERRAAACTHWADQLWAATAAASRSTDGRGGCHADDAWARPATAPAPSSLAQKPDKNSPHNDAQAHAPELPNGTVSKHQHGVRPGTSTPTRKPRFKGLRGVRTPSRTARLATARYADDIVIVVHPSEVSIALDICELWNAASGMARNELKTEGMWIGSLRNCDKPWARTSGDQSPGDSCYAHAPVHHVAPPGLRDTCPRHHGWV
jgi:hypothetical protein